MKRKKKSNLTRQEEKKRECGNPQGAAKFLAARHKARQRQEKNKYESCHELDSPHGNKTKREGKKSNKEAKTKKAMSNLAPHGSKTNEQKNETRAKPRGAKFLTVARQRPN
jgi:hypothetical protein